MAPVCVMGPPPEGEQGRVRGRPVPGGGEVLLAAPEYSTLLSKAVSKKGRGASNSCFYRSRSRRRAGRSGTCTAGGTLREIPSGAGEPPPVGGGLFSLAQS